MARSSRRSRTIHQTHVNHERWVISYADFVTLLFAFFVVMFATANAADKGKARAVSEAVKAALSESKSSDVSEAIREVLEKQENTEIFKSQAAISTAAELAPSLKLLHEQLHDEIAKGEVELRMEARGLTVSFKQTALFDSGEAIIKTSALPSIEKLADVLLKVPNQVRLEGHTDNIPIHTEHFNNNWELSSSRSVAVLQLLTDKFKVKAGRLAVSGYADVAPIASNDTEEGRTKNRRVDVVILSSLAASRESSQPSN